MRTNVVNKTPAPVTHEGATAKKITPVQQLRRLVLSTMLFEDQFYVDGKTIADQMTATVEAVLKTKNGPKAVSDLAIETRTEGKLRHAPLHLALSLVRVGNKNTKLGEECRAVVAHTLENVIQRPDELAEFLAMYFGGKKIPISNQVRKGLASAFTKFSDYQIRKYANREGAISLRDVMFLVHPKPLTSEQAGLWKDLANKNLVAPDTWESNLSAGKDKKETFERLLDEKKLGALALLRNLRNMQQSGVPEEKIREGLRSMSTDRVLPFRFISAANYAPKLEDSLEDAMFRSLKDYPKLKGKTVLLVDNSGSMYGTKVSFKSEIDRSDAACALAMLLREVCEQVEVIVFSDNAKTIPPRRGFALRESIKSATGHSSTNTAYGKQVADKSGYDRLIIFTDEQSHTNLTDPVPGSKGYVINVASYNNGIGYGKWVHIDGFSESAVDFIQMYENLSEEE